MTSLRDVKRAHGSVCTRKRQLAEARQKHINARISYLREHPLDPITSKAVRLLFEKGLPLCCEKGRENLEALKLNWLWVDHINRWAYEALGCSEGDRPGGYMFERDCEALRVFLADPAGDLQYELPE